MVSEKSLVSIVTPCYNAEKYISKLLDSILIQAYPNIEAYIIDDGSTDGSARIIESYIPKFFKKGYSLSYVHQPNQGQSVAVKNGLQKVKGEYLVWPDADDYYASSGVIAKMVDCLAGSNDETSLVRVQYNVVDEAGNKITRMGVNNDTRYKTNLFEDAVFGQNGFWYPPGGYMAKMAKIDELISGRNIYTEKQAGQNFQLYLPLLYKHKCITLEEYLYNIVAHDDSHSRTMATNNNRQQVYYRTIKNTLDTLPLEKKYRSYLMARVKKMTTTNSTQLERKRPYRTYTKRAIKGMIPYGLMMMYKRRSRNE